MWRERYEREGSRYRRGGGRGNESWDRELGRGARPGEASRSGYRDDYRTRPQADGYSGSDYYDDEGRWESEEREPGPGRDYRDGWSEGRWGTAGPDSRERAERERSGDRRRPSVRWADDYGFGAQERGGEGYPGSYRQERDYRIAGGEYWSQQPRPGSGLTNGESFAGRGPKGWKRSDERIKEDLSEELARNAELDASEIEVTVVNCEVTLTGAVPDRRSKRLAEDIADDVIGVSDVRNQLRVTSGENRAQLREGQSQPESSRVRQPGRVTP